MTDTNPIWPPNPIRVASKTVVLSGKAAIPDPPATGMRPQENAVRSTTATRALVVALLTDMNGVRSLAAHVSLPSGVTRTPKVPPAGTGWVTVFVAVSILYSERPPVTKTVFPSGVIATPNRTSLIGTVATTVLVTALMTDTLPPVLFAT